MGRRDDFWPFCGDGFKAGSKWNGDHCEGGTSISCDQNAKIESVTGDPFLKIKIIDIYMYYIEKLSEKFSNDRNKRLSLV